MEGKPEDDYDWERDTMSEQWNGKKALASVKALPDAMICDILLNQEIFAGVGNIIKNEALFITKVYPESKVKNIPEKKLKEIVKVAREYCFDFYKWKKAHVLKKHWLIHTKSVCPRCHVPAVKVYLGKTNRRTFFCPNCQVYYRG